MGGGTISIEGYREREPAEFHICDRDSRFRKGGAPGDLAAGQQQESNDIGQLRTNTGHAQKMTQLKDI